MKMGERLKMYLQEKGIKQSVVADRIGMNKKSFNAVLNGRAELKADTLEAVCLFIDVPPTFFFTNQVQENGNKGA